MYAFIRDEKDEWIRCKYQQKEFLATLPYGDVAVHRVSYNLSLYHVWRKEFCSIL